MNHLGTFSGDAWRGIRRTKVVAGAVALAVGSALFLGPPATAFILVSSAPSMPNSMVGQTFPMAYGLGNFSSPPESADNPVLTISAIDLYPACSNGNVDCTGGTAEGGVFALSATGNGSSSPPGDADCEGTWTIVPDTGNANTAVRFRFVPPGGEGTLTIDTGEMCTVSLTAVTRRAPVIDVNPGAPGIQANAVASATATGTSIGSLRNSGIDVVTIGQGFTGLSTSAGQSGPTIPATTSDTATLTPTPPSMSDGTPPTGAISFGLFGPNDATCSGPPTYTNVVPVTGFGSYSTSASASVLTPGTYQWVATYSGDANYLSAGDDCGDPEETVTFGQASSTITTQATTPVTIGAPINDTATVVGVGGLTPTGTVSFTTFGPGDPTCAGPPAFVSSPRPLTAGSPPAASANSGNFTPTAVGAYRWVAVYSGDANYAAVTSPCGAANETSIVNQATASISTTATPSVTIGSPISDQATVTPASPPTPAPTGTVTFTLFGPDNPACVGPPIFTSTVALPGSLTAGSGNFVPTAAGTYRWVAVYSGDANYAPVTSPCGAVNEASVVTQAAAATFNDFDGDGATDLAVFRPSNNAWYTPGASVVWGVDGDIPVPGDYDGDGKTDLAVFRPSDGVWYVLRSGGGSTSSAWGTGGDIPVPGDYDGDGKTDLAVFRPSEGVWYVQRSGGGCDLGRVGCAAATSRCRRLRRRRQDRPRRVPPVRRGLVRAAQRRWCDVGRVGHQRRHPGAGRLRRRRQDRPRRVPPVRGGLVRAGQRRRCDVGRVGRQTATSRCRATTTATARPTRPCSARPRGSGTCSAAAAVRPRARGASTVTSPSPCRRR